MLICRIRRRQRLQFCGQQCNAESLMFRLSSKPPLTTEDKRQSTAQEHQYHCLWQRFFYTPLPLLHTHAAPCGCLPPLEWKTAHRSIRQKFLLLLVLPEPGQESMIMHVGVGETDRLVCVTSPLLRMGNNCDLLAGRRFPSVVAIERGTWHNSLCFSTKISYLFIFFWKFVRSSRSHLSTRTSMSVCSISQ